MADTNANTVPEVGDAPHAEQLTQWKAVWDEIYEHASSLPDPRFNITGWNSSYTGTPIPPEDMSELQKQGIGRLFGPGTPTSELIEYIESWAKSHLES